MSLAGTGLGSEDGGSHTLVVTELGITRPLPSPADGDEFGDWGTAGVVQDSAASAAETEASSEVAAGVWLEQLPVVEGIPVPEPCSSLLLEAAGLLPAKKDSPGAPTWEGSAAQSKLHRLLFVDGRTRMVQDGGLLCALPAPPPPIIPRRSVPPTPVARGALRLGLLKLKQAADDAERSLILAADKIHREANRAVVAVKSAIKG